MLHLNDEFQQRWRGADPYALLQSMEGKVFRQVKGRKTFQFELDGKSYFAKLHLGVGWVEIVKNLLQLRLPILGARNEWQAIQTLEKLGIDTMTAVAYGERGRSPAHRQSFIITEALTNTTSLEDFCRDWQRHKPEFRLKQQLLFRVATISRRLHGNGICHRDFYLCHFLLHNEKDHEKDHLHDMDQAVGSGGPRLSLIDLHRALIKRKLPTRWIVKDLAGLYYSAMERGLTSRDLLRFVKYYEQCELNEAMRLKGRFWDAVNKRANRMFQKLGSASPPI